MVSEREVKKFIEAAKNGDKVALSGLISQTQDHIYGLALRFLWNEEDAKEAAQEILSNRSRIKVPRRLCRQTARRYRLNRVDIHWNSDHRSDEPKFSPTISSKIRFGIGLKNCPSKDSALITRSTRNVLGALRK